MRNVHGLVSLAFSLALGSCVLAAPPAAPEANEALLFPARITSVRPAAEFCDSVGVCTHWGWFGTPYVDRFNEVSRLLQESGIRHVRSDLSSSPQPLKNMQSLAAKGYRFCFNTFRDSPKTTIKDKLAPIRKYFPNSVDYIEGHNEPDMSWRDADGKKAREGGKWVEGVRAWQEELWRVTQGDPMLKKIAILGSAPAYPNRVASQMGDWSKICDLGNFHPYSGGRPPEVSIAKFVNDIQPLYPHMQLVITETGYHTAVDNPRGGHEPVSEKAKGIYLPREYLEYYRLGFPRTYTYQFVDDSTMEAAKKRGAVIDEAAFGMIGYDLTPKPSYHAVKNLLAILKDRANPDFKPQALEYTVESANAELRQLLLQKANGDYYLALWRAVPVWDLKTRTDVRVEPKKYLVAFKQPMAEVAWYRPNASTDAVQTRKGLTKAPVELDGAVTILAIKPR